MNSTICDRPANVWLFMHIISGQYWNELTRLRNIWVVLDEIAVLSTKKEDDSVSSKTGGLNAYFRN